MKLLCFSSRDKEGQLWVSHEEDLLLRRPSADNRGAAVRWVLISAVPGVTGAWLNAQRPYDSRQDMIRPVMRIGVLECHYWLSGMSCRCPYRCASVCIDLHRYATLWNDQTRRPEVTSRAWRCKGVVCRAHVVICGSKRRTQSIFNAKRTKEYKHIH